MPLFFPASRNWGTKGSFWTGPLYRLSRVGFNAPHYHIIHEAFAGKWKQEHEVWMEGHFLGFCVFNFFKNFIAKQSH